MSEYRALVDKWRVTLSANTAALFALFDNPPQGLTGPELDELRLKRAAAVTTAARQLESVIKTGKAITFRATGDEVL